MISQTGELLMKASRIIGTIVFLISVSFGVKLEAQEAPSATPYSGDLWNRSTLTGDWGGFRNELAAKGVTIDMNVTQVGQGVVNGGKSGAWQYGGRGNITINADSQKLGLWPGGFFNLELEGNWASSVNPNTGALMAVNNNQLFPLPPGDIFAVPAWNFTQFLSPYAGISIGKLDTTSGDMNEFAHGKGDTQFMNTALNFNAVALFTVPYSTLGIAAIVLPTKDPKEAILNFSVIQTNGLPNVSGFDDLNGNKLTFGGEGRVRTDFFGLTGHQLFGATFSNQKFTSVDQSVRVIIENRSLKPEKGSWNIHYNFDQYLYEPKKGSGRGVGIFGRLGVSDGNPNFMKFYGSFGIAGKGVFDSRPHDQFGWGYYYINVNNPTIQGPLQTSSLLRDEYGFEWYYNFALTPWMMLTPDIQVVRGAQKNKVTITQGPLGVLPRVDKKSIGTSTVLGLRLQLLF
jgi:porin